MTARAIPTPCTEKLAQYTTLGEPFAGKRDKHRSWEGTPIVRISPGATHLFGI
jgi:hypothetical protein